MPTGKADHRDFAARLEQRVFTEPAETTAKLRQDMGRRAAGGPPIAPPYDELAHQIGEAAYRVTDAQVAAVRALAGTDRAAFELVAAAAVGAALKRWKAGQAAIDEASGA
jgi:hypothetical protein